MLPPRHRRAATRALLWSIPAALVAACASASNTPPDQVAITPNTVRVETPGGMVEARTTAEDRAEARTINVKPDVAWAKLPAVYAELGLPVNAYVDATRQIASKGTRVRGRIGNVRVASIVTCGTDVTGDDKANSYEISLDVSTAIGANANGQTDVLTMVIANGRPMSTSGEAVRCVSTGSLEKRIANGIIVKSAAP